MSFNLPTNLAMPAGAPQPPTELKESTKTRAQSKAAAAAAAETGTAIEGQSTEQQASVTTTAQKQKKTGAAGSGANKEASKSKSPADPTSSAAAARTADTRGEASSGAAASSQNAANNAAAATPTTAATTSGPQQCAITVAEVLAMRERIKQLEARVGSDPACSTPAGAQAPVASGTAAGAPPAVQLVAPAEEVEASRLIGAIGREPPQPQAVALPPVIPGKRADIMALGEYIPPFVPHARTHTHTHAHAHTHTHTHTPCAMRRRARMSIHDARRRMTPRSFTQTLSTHAHDLTRSLPSQRYRPKSTGPFGWDTMFPTPSSRRVRACPPYPPTTTASYRH